MTHQSDIMNVLGHYVLHGACAVVSPPIMLLYLSEHHRRPAGGPDLETMSERLVLRKAKMIISQ